MVRPLEALAEDCRRVGVAGIITGLVGGFLQDEVPGTLGLLAVVLGLALNVLGYWFHRQAGRRE
mgnify:CR=1 FL=1